MCIQAPAQPRVSHAQSRSGQEAATVRWRHWATQESECEHGLWGDEGRCGEMWLVVMITTSVV